MRLTQKQWDDDICYYTFYLYTKICEDEGSYTVAVYRNCDDALSNHPAQCVINGKRYPAAWSSENPFEIPFTIKIRVENGEWVWLADKCTYMIETISTVHIRAANTNENPNDFFIYVSNYEGNIDIEVYRSLDDAILGHLPPANNPVACWDARGPNRWEISLGKVWKYERGKNIQLITKTTLGNAVQVHQYRRQ